MKVSDISTMLKVNLVNKGTKYYSIGDHIEVISSTLITDSRVGCAGVLTKITPDSIRVTDYNGNDNEVLIEDIEEVINE